jgi:hypothetical protein
MEQIREHLTEIYNKPRAKKGCHGRWLKLVEVGFESFFSSLLDNSFVEQVDDPAMYLSLYGVLWSLGIQYK